MDLLTSLFVFGGNGILYLIPGLVLGIYASFLVHHRFKKYSQIQLHSGKVAHEIAREILDFHHLSHVKVERISGHLSDHFDPTTNIVRLSDSVYSSSSIAAAGIAAHEVGHAIQHAQKYVPIQIRNGIFPVVRIASGAWLWIFLAGMFLASHNLLLIGTVAFGVMFIFQIITLPVEFDASSRAKKILRRLGIVSRQELEGIEAVLGAAALTYVAAAVQSLLQLLRMVSMLRNDDR